MAAYGWLKDQIFVAPDLRPFVVSLRTTFDNACLGIQAVFVAVTAGAFASMPVVVVRSAGCKPLAWKPVGTVAGAAACEVSGAGEVTARRRLAVAMAV